MATATRGRRRTATKPVEVVEDDAIEELDTDEVDELELDEPEEIEEEPAPKRTRRTTKAAPAAKATPAKKATAPAKRTAKPAPVEDDDEDDAGPVYDTNWLAEYVNETAGTDYDSRAMRMLLRKLAHEGTISREVGTDRSRYTFPKAERDPIVKAVLRAVRSADDEPAPAPAKKAPAKKAPAKAAPTKKAAAPARRRRAAAPVDDDDE